MADRTIRARDDPRRVQTGDRLLMPSGRWGTVSGSNLTWATILYDGPDKADGAHLTHEFIQQHCLVVPLARMGAALRPEGDE